MAKRAPQAPSDQEFVLQDNNKPDARLKTVNNSLRIRIDDLKTFAPLTANQKLFYDA